MVLTAILVWERHSASTTQYTIPDLEEALGRIGVEDASESQHEQRLVSRSPEQH